MKNSTPFVIMMLLIFQACTQNQVSYHIVRTDYVKATHKHFEWILQNDSVKVIEYPMSSDPVRVRCYEALTSRQADRLQEILQDIDLSKMKDNYTNSAVEGEGNPEYDITINGVSKHIYVYYVDVPELKKIDEFLFDVTADCK